MPRRVRVLWPDGSVPAPLPEGFEEPGYRPDGERAVLGRGGACPLVWPDGRRCFWREYRHGGALGSCLGASYWSAQVLEREIADSARLLRAGVSVPRPVAGRVERRLLARLALVTEHVDGVALDATRDTGALRNAGAMCARLHGAGFRHQDLHPGNLLVRPDGGVTVLDLAGGRWGGRHADRSARRSLVRLARWFEKHHGRPPGTREVLAFLRGYEPDRARRRELFERLVRLRRRSLPRHRLRWLFPGR